MKYKTSVVTASLLLSSIVSLHVGAVDSFRGASLVKSTTESSSEFEVPMAQISRVGRGWEPEKVERVQGEQVQTLYKIGRNADLTEVIGHYQAQLSQYPVLFECESRACGSANAWANNFFGDYLLYGPDGTQWLKVVRLSEAEYLTIYVNRRGAGDVMVRADTVRRNSDGQAQSLVKQLDVYDLPRIRAFLLENSAPSLVAVVVGESGSTTQTIRSGDELIEQLRDSLPTSDIKRIRFINGTHIAGEHYGYERVLFILE